MRQPSGRFVLRIPRDLHRKLKSEAARDDVSLNQVCLVRLSGGTQTSAGVTQYLPERLWMRVLEKWRKHLLGIVLFGSVARDEATEESDTDLLLVLDPRCRISRQLYRDWDSLLEETDARRGENISPQFVVLPSNPLDAGGLWYEVAVEGVVLFDPQSKVSSFLRSIRGEMARGAIRQAFAYGHPYWIREGSPTRA